MMRRHEEGTRTVPKRAAPSPDRHTHAPPTSEVLALQRSAGNRATSLLVQRGVIDQLAAAARAAPRVFAMRNAPLVAGHPRAQVIAACDQAHQRAIRRYPGLERSQASDVGSSVRGIRLMVGERGAGVTLPSGAQRDIAGGFFLRPEVIARLEQPSEADPTHGSSPEAAAATEFLTRGEQRTWQEMLDVEVHEGTQAGASVGPADRAQIQQFMGSVGAFASRVAGALTGAIGRALGRGD